MASAGFLCLAAALAISLYGIGASLYGARAGRREYVDSGRRAVYAMAGLLVVAMLILQLAFVRSDFSFELVATHSSTTTPLFYRLTAVWSSQEGSLLLWVLLLSLWSSAILFATRRSLREVAPYATAVLLGFGVFFTGLLVFLESPFTLLAAPPAEGTGLNPLLRHPSMMIHPPMLYSGYTLFAIPFAFAIGALITRRLGSEWIRSTRPFTLAAWMFLGFGILLGARWSYMELGWGGYWAWDPVENASLMPWLTGTAFLHSVMIQEKRGMLKVWNVSLVLATGVLAILGTFLVRSGILESIHAFGASTLGVPFLALIGVMIAGSIALVVSRAESLRSDHRLDSLLSREAAFLLNNLVLVALCFVVFWGTFFPLISEAVTGEEASVGPPWFDRYITPLALILVLLSGIGPLIAWRRATAANLKRNFALPVGVGAGTAVLLIALGVTGSIPALLMFSFAAFVVGGGRAGAVARRRRAARDVGRLAAGRPGLARAPQPRALRRLHRPRRDRGAVRRRRGVVRVPGPAPRRAAAGAERPRRGRDDHLREADLEARRGEQRPARADRPRRRARASSAAGARRGPSRRTSPTSRARRRTSARSRASSRARRRARSGCRPGSGATCGPRSRPTSGACGRGSTRATRSSPTPRACPRTSASSSSPRRSPASPAPTRTTRRRRRSASSPRRW